MSLLGYQDSIHTSTVPDIKERFNVDAFISIAVALPHEDKVKLMNSLMDSLKEDMGVI